MTGEPVAHARLIMCCTAIVLAFIWFPSDARAASTRTGYVAEIEPICQAAQAPTLKAYVQLAKAAAKARSTGRLNGTQDRRALAQPMARFLRKLSIVYSHTTSRIAAIPPPAGDETTVGAWLALRDAASETGIAASRSAKHRKARRSFRLFDEAVSISEKGSELVSGYGMTFCTLPLGDTQVSPV
jgi:hypothetical protein